MIEPQHLRPSIARQCELVSIGRSGFYHRPAGETALDLEPMRLIDARFLETPWYGSRQMARQPRREGRTVGRKRVRRPMAKVGLAPIQRRPRTTVPHRVYPYPLRDRAIERPYRGWCADSTYTPMRRGSLRLVAIMDWTAREVAARRVSNAMDVEFCPEMLEEALARFGRPGIFNTDQGSRLTPPRFTSVLQGAGVRVSTDGRGRWMDNVFIERLWRGLKYECVYLHVFETGSGLRAGLAEWIGYYNRRRPHSALALDRLRRSLLRGRIARAMTQARRGIRDRRDGDAETGGLTENRTEFNRVTKLSEEAALPYFACCLERRMSDKQLRKLANLGLLPVRCANRGESGLQPGMLDTIHVLTHTRARKQHAKCGRAEEVGPPHPPGPAGRFAADGYDPPPPAP